METRVSLKYFVNGCSIVNTTDHVKSLFLNNQQCTTQTTFIDLHPNVCIEGLHYYPFAVNLDRCMESCNTLNNLSNEVSVPNKTEDLNLSVFNTITTINVSKILTKHISCECRCKFGGRKCNSSQKWNNDKCWCECKNLNEHNACKKVYIWNCSTCICENNEYWASSIDDSVITRHKIISGSANVMN